MGDTHVGLQARLMSQALRKLTGTLSKSSTIAVFINQLREKIGVMYGSPEVTPGGRALKFYASIRLDIRRIESIKDGAEVVGNRTRVKVVKNKCSAPFRQAEFDIMYGKGISREGSLLDVAVELGFIKKSGAWFTYEGEQLGQGRENVKTFLSESPQLMAEVDDRVREFLAPKWKRAPKKAPRWILTTFRSCSTDESSRPRVICPPRIASEWGHGDESLAAAGLPPARSCGPYRPISLSTAQAVGTDGLQCDSQPRAGPNGRCRVHEQAGPWGVIPPRGVPGVGPFRGIPATGSDCRCSPVHACEPE